MRDLLGALELRAQRQQCIDVQLGPAVILGRGEFDVIGLQFDRHTDDVFDVIDIAAMNNDIQHHRVTLRLDCSRHLELVLKTVGTTKKVVECFVAGLEADLDVVKSGLLEVGDAGFVHADTGRDQVAVVTQLTGLGNERFQIFSDQRFAAGQAELHGTELACLGEYPEPVLGGQFPRYSPPCRPDSSSTDTAAGNGR